MATLNLTAYSVAFPTISNDIRVDISTQLNPLAIVASHTESAPHPVRLWSFPGLDRTNYVFQMNEIDGTGTPLRQLAYFDVVPGDLTNGIFRAEEQIKVGTTIGLTAGTSAFIFDGTSGKPDYTGWEISIEEYSGVGTMIRGTDYSWDKTTGTFAYINGMVFASSQWFTVEFEPQIGGAASVPSVVDFPMRIITANETLTPNDFGTKILLEPSGNYIEISLPNIDLVPVGRYLMLESQTSQSFKCIKILPNGANIISFLHGSLYMMLGENLYIYKFFDGVSRKEWRICNQAGNFHNCGQLVSDDLSNVYNKVLANGGGGDGLDVFQYARLYNEVVLRLPATQRVNYDSWSTNQTFYSLANSANPSFANKFRIPNRLGLVEKANPTGRLIGSYEPDFAPIPDHYHYLFADEDSGNNGVLVESMQVTRAAGLGGNSSYSLQKTLNAAGVGRSSSPNTVLTGEVTVKNYSVNKYILV